MTTLMLGGEKFALIALETRSAVDLPPTELTSALWASSAPMIDLGQFWKDELGKKRTRDFHCCTLFLLVKDQATESAVDQRLQDRVWQFYIGMLLADRYGTDQVPFFITGDVRPHGVNVRSVDPLEPLRHAPADRWSRLSNNQVRRGAEIAQAIQNFPWIGAHRLNAATADFPR